MDIRYSGVVAGSVGKMPTCQDLIDPSRDVVMREEENTREEKIEVE